jgi:competence protein ComEC
MTMHSFQDGHLPARRAVLSILIGVCLALAALGAPVPAAHGQALLTVHFIDVGQGDSILIQLPEGTTILIDGGNADGRALAYLEALGISQIDIMALTHPHADHVGGLVAILQAIPVKAVWTSGALTTTSIFEQFIDAITEKAIPYFEVKSGEGLAFGDVQLQALFSQSQADDLNDTSLVLRLTYGQMSFLFMGDASLNVESQMLQTVSAQLTSTVLKVGHHGSNSASSQAFLEAVRPSVAVYSAGAGNSYGHPHRETLARLEAVRAIIYGTDVHGSVLITTDGTTYEVQTEKANPPIGSMRGANLNGMAREGLLRRAS